MSAFSDNNNNNSNNRRRRRLIKEIIVAKEKPELSLLLITGYSRFIQDISGAVPLIIIYLLMWFYYESDCWDVRNKRNKQLFKITDQSIERTGKSGCAGIMTTFNAIDLNHPIYRKITYQWTIAVIETGMESFLIGISNIPYLSQVSEFRCYVVNGLSQKGTENNKNVKQINTGDVVDIIVVVKGDNHGQIVVLSNNSNQLYCGEIQAIDNFHKYHLTICATRPGDKFELLNFKTY